MFVSSGQFYIFLSCVTFGGLCGFFYSLIVFVKKFIKSKWFNSILDLLFFLCIGTLFVVYSFKFNFPNVRVYMLVGVLLGLILYMESFHLILANLLKKLYNKKVIKKRIKD